MRLRMLAGSSRAFACLGKGHTWKPPDLGGGPPDVRLHLTGATDWLVWQLHECSVAAERRAVCRKAAWDSARSPARRHGQPRPSGPWAVLAFADEQVGVRPDEESAGNAPDAEPGGYHPEQLMPPVLAADEVHVGPCVPAGCGFPPLRAASQPGDRPVFLSSCPPSESLAGFFPRKH